MVTREACVGSLNSRKKRRCRFTISLVALLAVMWRRGARPVVVAFAGFKRPLLRTTRNALHSFVPFSNDSCQVWPRCTRTPSCHGAHRFCFAAARHPTDDDKNESSRPKRDTSSKQQRHVVLNSVDESLKRDVLSHITSDSSSNSEPIVLLVGVSGGCDSVGLLHALTNILTRVDDKDNHIFQVPNHPNTRTAFSLHVVHFNHKQRGENSNGDAEFVRELCDELQLPCHFFDWGDDSSTAAAAATFSQDSARQWRRFTMYSLLQTLVPDPKQSIGVILTAHHVNDSQESLLLKMIRGVHLTNLQGMDPVVVVDSEDDMLPNAIMARPLLHVRKADIVDYLELHGLTWREDESNASDKYLRNRVRNELIPLLSDIMGGDDILQKRLDHVSKQSRELNEDLARRAQQYLEDMKKNEEENVFVLSSNTQTAMKNLVEKQALHQWAQSRMGFPLPFEQLQRICSQVEEHTDQQTWTLQVGRGWNIVRNGAILSVKREGMGSEEEKTPRDREIAWSFVEKNEELDCCMDEKTLLIQVPHGPNSADYDLSFVLSSAASHVKKWGFTPPWRENPVALRDFLRGQKVPLHRRACTPVVLWVHHHDDESSLVAVFVERQDGSTSYGNRRGKWIVNAKFSVKNQEGPGGRRIRLELFMD